MADVKRAYRVDGRDSSVQLATHPAVHAFDMKAAPDLFDVNLLHPTVSQKRSSSEEQKKGEVWAGYTARD
jgi:hypothetical protein